LVVYSIVSVMHGHKNIKFISGMQSYRWRGRQSKRIPRCCLFLIFPHPTPPHLCDIS